MKMLLDYLGRIGAPALTRALRVRHYTGGSGRHLDAIEALEIAPFPTLPKSRVTS